MRWSPLLPFVVASSLLAACKKDGGGASDSTPPNDGTANTGGDDDSGEPIVPQDPDPPELASALTRLVLGDTQAVKTAMEPLTDRLSAPSQARAAGIAFALYALASAEEVAESAKEPAEQAKAKADEVRDPEARQLAAMAMGAYLIGVGEAAAAQVELDAATTMTAPHVEFARLYLARALLNQAFDEDDKLVDASKLDLAEASYRQAIDASADPAIKGRGSSGLAAIAKYRGKTADVCTHAATAAQQLQAAGATDYLAEVPSLLASEAQCK